MLIKWHKNDGDSVAAAEPLAELETDKANVDIPAPTAGVLKRVKKEGDTVAIGDTIARIENAQSPAAPPREQNKPTAEKAPENKEAPSAKPDDQRPSVRRIVEENKLDPAAIKGSGPGGKITKEESGYHVWPVSGREQTCPIVFLAPSDGPNAAQIGYDLVADPDGFGALENSHDWSGDHRCRAP